MPIHRPVRLRGSRSVEGVGVWDHGLGFRARRVFGTMHSCFDMLMTDFLSPVLRSLQVGASV